MDVSVGVVTHNDLGLLKLLESVLSQEVKGDRVAEVIVVSSGILPQVRDGISALRGEHSNLKLIIEPKREGKASAVNAFLKAATGDVLVLVGGDVLLDPCSLDCLLAPFKDASVGMTGGRTVPLNGESTFVGFAVNLVWRMHHRLSQVKPKMGEFVAFRNVVREISPKTAVDEAWIESLVSAKGMRIVYAPDAIVRNMGPKSIGDYVTQRRRIHAGHLLLKRQRGYSVSSIRYPDVLKALIVCAPRTWGGIVWTLFAVLLELYVRMLASVDVSVLGRNPYRWDIVESAKIG